MVLQVVALLVKLLYKGEMQNAFHKCLLQESGCLLESRAFTSLSHSLNKVNILSDFVLLCSLAYEHIVYGSLFSAGDRMRVLHSEIECHKMMQDHLRFADNTLKILDLMKLKAVFR